MKTYQAGKQVEYGIYISPKSIDCRFVGADNETLEGKPNATYYRLPTIVAIAAAPILGGIFVMTFPLLIIMMFAYAVCKPLIDAGKYLAKESEFLGSFQWQPTAAYLNKKPQDGENKTETTEEKTEQKQ